MKCLLMIMIKQIKIQTYRWGEQTGAGLCICCNFIVDPGIFSGGGGRGGGGKVKGGGPR